MLMLWTGFERPNKVAVGAIKLGGSQVAVVKFMTRAHMPKQFRNRQTSNKGPRCLWFLLLRCPEAKDRVPLVSEGFGIDPLCAEEHHLITELGELGFQSHYCFLDGVLRVQ